MANDSFLVLHSDASDEAASRVEREAIEADGAEPRLTRSASENEPIEQLRDAGAVLVTSAPITHRVVETRPRHQLIVRSGAGLDTLDVFETEPLPMDSPLIKLENMAMMPRSTSYSAAPSSACKSASRRPRSR